MKDTMIIGIFTIFAALSLAACVTQDLPPEEQEEEQDTGILEQGTYVETSYDPDKPVAILSFETEEEYEEFVESHEWSSYAPGYARGGMAVETVALADAAVKSESPQNGYSETNNQVAGIDEADIIKTDGEYIYTISGNVLYIVKAYPGEDAKVIATIDYDENSPESLFVQDDTLAVFGNFNELEVFSGLQYSPRHGMSFFYIYDISDKENPELLKEYRFEGNYFNARMKEDHAYLVVQNMPSYSPRYPGPVIMEDGELRSVPVSDIHYYNIPYRTPQFVTVHAIDLMDPEEEITSRSVAVEASQNMYMSEDNIFITYTEWISEWELRQDILVELLEESLTEDDKRLIEKIKATDNEVLSQQEKEQKIREIHLSYLNFMSSDERDELEEKAEELLEERLKKLGHLEFTVINKLEVDDGEIKVRESGKVPGRIINQFSMDEDTGAGVFRIATTISRRWSSFEVTESSNNVYTLDSDMEILGKLEGLAETEQIYSTRFIEDRLYMVTFRQVDPFFVIDLSDPSEPEMLGKLKIPGFSRYLHPYSEDVIIGIGKEATGTGRTTGLKISLFDVSDVEEPEEIAKFVTEERYAQSNALYEHKAFLFDRQKELLVIPAYSYDYRGNSGYNGAFVFHIAEDEIELHGLIDHSGADATGRYHYQPQVERSLWIEDLLYTKSRTLLRVNDIGSLQSVANLTLQKKTTDIPIY